MTAETAMRWRAVAVDGAVFDDLSAQGFGGVEECTEYDFSDGFSLKRQREPKGAPKVKKRKQASSGLAMKPSKTGCSLESNAEDAPNANDGLEEVLAWSHFGLPSPLLRALAARGFAKPTQIQALTLPAAILGRRDILGAAETGSGKTLAFGLPLLAGILEEKSRKSEDEKSKAEGDRATRPLYALILTPTRELAMQVKNHLVDAARFTDIRIAVVVGGMAAVKQERILRGQPEVVVATPGRLWELVQQGNPHLSRIAHIRYLVIDETDRMLERGHFEELHSLLEKLNDDEEARRRRQNFVFSATLTLVHEPPRYVRRGGGGRRAVAAAQTPEQKLRRIVEALGIADPKVVDVTGGGRAGSGSGTSGTLTECRITCAFDDKDHYVYYFAQRHPGRTIVFCNSIGCVRRLAHLLRLLECRALPLHSAMQQKQRLKNLERFRDDDLGILVATDVAARGLDIPSVDHVLHYQTPRTTESYVHRSGRTARAHKQGITVLLMEPTEIQSYIKLCNTLGRSEDLPLFPVQENYLNAVKQRVNLARDLDRLQLSVQKTTSETGWIQKAAEEMDIIVDDFARKFDDDAVSPNKKLATLKQKQLATLLTKPIFPKNFSGKYPLTNNLDLEEVMGNRTPGKAVEVMKAALEERQQKKKKTKAIPLFKPRNKNNNDGSEQEQRRADLGAAVKRLRRAEMGRKGGKKRVGKKKRK